MTRSFRPAALLALSLLPLLAACGRGGDVLSQRPRAPCPRVALLADAVDLTRYRAGAVPDVGTVEVDARMVGLQARCDYAPREAGLDVTLVVQVTAERGPAAIRAADLPYVVAVTDEAEGRILNRGTDTVTVTFAGNERRTAAQGEQMMIRIPGDVRRAAERVVLVGFQLTPEELAANRRRGAR
ncbi:hypothetical protein [Roseomonas indoligenes]|uniref:Uncharacterized protein n=1 Tax=Roseomonas indoligenes TaxID=2820811 RepID=A0A940MT82_9PROT|nr:hypothetical protein [Pararoseomonas indoligenes]MBP0491258.1 hypothetical protein [Pararoseomonas indoligenes]